MRLFKKKSDSPGHQEYLDGLITSIRKARREEEEKPGLHAFVEEDKFPMTEAPGPPRVPPGVAKAAGLSPENAPEGEDAEEIANLEAYLSQLEAADAAPSDEENGESGQSASNF
jgi:hypothetical protein